MVCVTTLNLTGTYPSVCITSIRNTVTLFFFPKTSQITRVCVVYSIIIHERLYISLNEIKCYYKTTNYLYEIPEFVKM